MHTARHRAPAAGWARARTELARLLLPVECAGCGRLDTDLCPPCLRALTGPALPVGDLVGADPPAWAPLGLPLHAVAEFAGSSRRALVAWKDDGRADVTPVMGAALARALGSLLAGTTPRQVLVLAVPSAGAAVRRRGGDLVAEAAAAAVRRSTALPTGVRIRWAALMRHAGGGLDQSGLSARRRTENVAGRIRCVADLRGWDVVLVDDVVTTGATLAETARAAADAGAVVGGAAVVAATRRRDLRPGVSARPPVDYRQGMADPTGTSRPPAPERRDLGRCHRCGTRCGRGWC